ncbi:MAG: hypothetical protein JSV92_04230 [archaeon]|nr:MAG: hypothetical protein JSV92_04230 [archaeon]
MVIKEREVEITTPEKENKKSKIKERNYFLKKSPEEIRIALEEICKEINHEKEVKELN